MGQAHLASSAYEKLMARIYEQGSHGVYVAGNTGEGYLMTIAERKLATEIAVKASKGHGTSSSTCRRPLGARCR